MDNWLPPPCLVEHTIMSFADAMSLPWHITQYGIDKNVWPIASGEGIRVGIVDTGVSRYHAEQGGLADRVMEADDFSGSRNGWEDSNGHGTHVAGIVAGKPCGVSPMCKLIISKALGENGAGTDRAVAAALGNCAKHGANVINLSLGSDTDSPTILGMVRELEQQGILIVAAAGNSGGGVNSPGRDQHTICDAAIDQNGVVAAFSCHGPRVDCCAPGVQILSLGLGMQMVLMSGTSMSSPWVSGMLANYQSWLLKKRQPLIKGALEAVAVLTSGSDDLGDPGRDELYGVGLPDSTKMFKDTTPVVVPITINKPRQAVITMDDGKTYQLSLIDSQ